MNFDSIYFQCYSYENMTQTDSEKQRTQMHTYKAASMLEAAVVNARDTTPGVQVNHFIT